MNEYEDALRQWTAGKPAEAQDDLLLSPRDRAEQADAIARIDRWVRERFKLADTAVVSVAEVACNLPGCPPLETSVSFWEGETRHHFKLFKRVREVVPDNLPYAWMKESLIVPEGFDCECC